MKIQWLGTAAAEGWPGIFCRCSACRRAEELGGRNIRTRASALIDGILLVDLDPDLYAQKLKLHLDLRDIRDVIITHNHGDHITPLYMEFRKRNYYLEDLPILPVYGPADALELLAPYREYIEAHPVEAGDVFSTSEHTIFTLPAVHSAPNGKYYLIERDGKTILYMHDTGILCIEDAVRMLRGHLRAPMDLVSMDCTYGPNPLPKGYTSHMGFAENIRLKERFLQEGIADDHTRFVSSHFSHNGRMLYDEMTEYMKPYGIEIAYDGMTAEV